MLNSWEFNLIVSLLSGIVFSQCFKIAVANAKHDGAATIIIQLIAGCTMIAIIPFFTLSLPHNPKPYLLLVTACIFYAISDRIQTTVRKHMEVSTVAVLGQISNVFLVIFGFLLFREPLIATKILGALFIIGGNVILQYRGKRFVWDRYVALTMLGGLSLAIALSIDIGNSKSMTLPVYISITFLVPSLLIFLSERVPLKLIKQEIQHLNMRYVFITGFSWSLLIFFLLRAYQYGSVSTIVPLQATLVLWNVIVAFIIFQEKQHAWQKIIAAILVMLGIILTI